MPRRSRFELRPRFDELLFDEELLDVCGAYAPALAQVVLPG